jgi:lysozyme family protein
MKKLTKYNDFLLEKEFNSIVEDLFRIVEDVEGKWTGPRTIEWDYTKKEEEPEVEEEENDKDELTDFIINFGEKALNKLKNFLQKLPKEKIKEYYIKLVNKFKSLPETLRRKLIAGITGVFLTFVSLTYLVSSTPNEYSTGGYSLTDKQKTEIVDSVESKETQKGGATFEEAQKLVKLAEGGYSNDKGDVGNYIQVPGGKRFIGSNHGISAPILADYYKEQGVERLITKEDMMRLKYKTALKIYKNEYWSKQNLGTLTDQNVANVIYDGCVNQGIDGMRSVLRRALEENGLEIKDSDVIFSKEILSKANKLNQVDLFNSIKKYREERYRDSGTFDRHGEGWLNRLDDISYQQEAPTNDKV